ncbi:MAG: hypothetical protein ACBR11_19840, partial [Microcoleus sp.]|uniref:hypothetical protein n=1 Tax=Microcoleus sp. TaxID=44472 RepID=UPI0035263A60
PHRIYQQLTGHHITFSRSQVLPGNAYPEALPRDLSTPNARCPHRIYQQLTGHHITFSRSQVLPGNAYPEALPRDLSTPNARCPMPT